MGSLDTIATDYRKIPSGRLVVLGEPGSGKTILSMRLLLDFLNIRTKVEPVPVIFSIGAWNPAVSLRDYLTKCLTRDYPWLAVPAFNQSSLAGALIEKGKILPILDGFDEIAKGLQIEALTALNYTSMPLVLTSRIDEFPKVVTTSDVLTAAAVIELEALTPRDPENYLPRTTAKSTIHDKDSIWK